MKRQQSSAVGNIDLITRLFKNIKKWSLYLVPLALVFVTLFTITIYMPNAAIAATKFNSIQQKLINRFEAYIKASDMMAYDECYEMLSAYSKNEITKDQWKVFIFRSAGTTSYKVFDVVIEPEGRRARVDVSATRKFDGKLDVQSQTWIYEGNKWVRAFAEDRKPQPLNSNSEGKKNTDKDGISVTPKGVAYSDPAGTVTVEILKILTGGQVIDNHKMHAFQLSDMRKRGKELIYFEVKITNDKFDKELHISHYGFKLESDAGDTFSPKLTTDFLTGDIHKGRSVTGGIAFEIEPNTKPKSLRYRTDLQNFLGERIEIVSPDLQQILSNIQKALGKMENAPIKDSTPTIETGEVAKSGAVDGHNGIKFEMTQNQLENKGFICNPSSEFFATSIAKCKHMEMTGVAFSVQTRNYTVYIDNDNRVAVILADLVGLRSLEDYFSLLTNISGFFPKKDEANSLADSRSGNTLRRDAWRTNNNAGIALSYVSGVRGIMKDQVSVIFSSPSYMSKTDKERAK